MLKSLFNVENYAYIVENYVDFVEKLKTLLKCWKLLTICWKLSKRKNSVTLLHYQPANILPFGLFPENTPDN